MQMPQKPYSVKFGYSAMPIEASAFVTTPSLPMVEIKAKTRGMPAKLEATPAKESTPERIQSGNPPIVIAQASKKPSVPPHTAVITLNEIVLRYEPRMTGWLRLRIFSNVSLPLCSRNERITTEEDG